MASKRKAIAALLSDGNGLDGIKDSLQVSVNRLESEEATEKARQPKLWRAVPALFAVLFFVWYNVSFLAWFHASRIIATSELRSDAFSRFQQLEKDLRQSNVQFYMYELGEFLTPQVKAKVHQVVQLVDNQTCHFSNSYCADLEAEQFLLRALANHKQRCVGDEAACPRDLIHILPLPSMALFAVDCDTLPDLKKCGQRRYMKSRNEVFEALKVLQKHPRFQHGVRHVMLSLRSRFFKGREGRPYKKYLYNVTLANNFDPMACQDMLRDGTAGDYADRYEDSEPMTKSNMVLGIGITGNIPFQLATFKEWNAKRNFIFYRTRPTKSSFGATPYRRAPMERVNWTDFPESCIGYDLPPAEWLGNITNSKYCLIMRGDTPHTHALLRAVRVGCIPVLISDQYQRYAGPFKSLIKIANFSVSIPEADFIKNPQETLSAIQNLNDTVIKSTLEGMAFAQKLLFPDHPDSVFVEAFMKDAENSMKYFNAY